MRWKLLLGRWHYAGPNHPTIQQKTVKQTHLCPLGVRKLAEGKGERRNDFATSFLHFSLFSIALWDLANSRPVHSLMLSPYLFLCLPCLLSPFTVPCKMVLARPDEGKTCPCHCSLHLFTTVKKSSCDTIAC